MGEVAYVFVGFDGDVLEFKLPPSGIVGDLIRVVLSAYGVHEDDSECHLAGDRLYFAHEHVTALRDGETYDLRVPH